MKYVLIFIQVFLLTLPIVSQGAICEIDSLNPQELHSRLKEMPYSQVDSYLRQFFFDKLESIEGNGQNRQMVLAESYSRIKSDPDSFFETSGFLDQAQTLEYRNFLFGTYAFLAETISTPTLALFIETTKLVITNKNDNDNIRVTALGSCKEIAGAARNRGVPGLAQLDDFPGIFLGIISDVDEADLVRVSAVRAMSNQTLLVKAPQLFELLVSGKLGSVPVEGVIYTKLGSVKYPELLPTAIASLKSTKDNQLQRKIAYAIGFYDDFSIVEPLVDCIEQNKEGGSSCYSALNKQPHLVFVALQVGNNEQIELGLRACKFIRVFSEEIISSLVLLLGHENPQIVLSSAELLARGRDPEMVTMLLEQLEGAPGSEMGIFLKRLNIMSKAEVHVLKSKK